MIGCSKSHAFLTNQRALLKPRIIAANQETAFENRIEDHLD